MRKLFIVDDDEILRGQLVRSMERRGFDVASAGGFQEALAKVKGPFTHALIDMRLEDGNGLELVTLLRQKNSDIRVVMLTGYGNIATSVAAIKAGAIDYLTKPADPDAIEKALLDHKEPLPPPPEDPMSADRVRWEHIQRVYEQCGRNVSETARRLKMHRRTLQRILQKHAPHN